MKSEESYSSGQCTPEMKDEAGSVFINKYTSKFSPKSIFTFIGRILMAGSLGFLAISIVKNYHQVPHIEPSAAVFGALLFAIAAAILANVIGALAWRRLVTVASDDADREGSNLTDHKSGERATHPLGVRAAFRIWSLSNIAKYIPGNLFQYAGRFVLARRSGIQGETVIVSMVVEALLLCSAAGILILLGLASGSLGSTVIAEIIGEYSSIAFFGLVLMFILTILLLAYLFPKTRQEIIYQFSKVGVLGCLYALIGYIFAILMVGWSALVLLETLWRFDGPVGWYALSCGYALAFLLGYVVPGAPGGIGIREITMVSLFQAAIGAGLVLGLVVVLRMASILADLVCFALAVAIRKDAS